MSENLLLGIEGKLVVDAEYLAGVEIVGDVIDIDVGKMILDVVGSESGDSEQSALSGSDDIV